ncbi:MAG: hypothetical protein IKL07_05940, partial [Clostridium sp.]|nr:hypothetical protein [Clostridium sp.]
VIFPAGRRKLEVNVMQTDGGEEFCIRLCGKLWTEMPGENASGKYIKYRPFGILIMMAALPFTLYFGLSSQSDITGKIIGVSLFGFWLIVGIILFCISFKE